MTNDGVLSNNRPDATSKNTYYHTFFFKYSGIYSYHGNIIHIISETAVSYIYVCVSIKKKISHLFFLLLWRRQLIFQKKREVGDFGLCELNARVHTSSLTEQIH